MKLEFDASELDTEWSEIDLRAVLRETTKRVVEQLIQREVTRGFEPFREQIQDAIQKRATAILQAALDDIEHTPDDQIMRRLMDPPPYEVP